MPTAAPLGQVTAKGVGAHRSMRSSTRSVWSSSCRVTGEAAKLTCHMAAWREAQGVGRGTRGVSAGWGLGQLKGAGAAGSAR